MLYKPFGKLPSGKRLERIRESRAFIDGQFRNVQETSMLAPGASYPKLMYKFFFGRIPEREPSSPISLVPTDLHQPASDEPTIIWFGHSSYLLTIDGKRILVDPVFSGHASPFSMVGVKEFPFVKRYTIQDFPPIDIILLTHDHYDHLDYESIAGLYPRVGKFYTSLGVGEHLEYWGIEKSRVVEFDWWESATLWPGAELTAAPSRHFSGRMFNRNQSLWASFILKTSSLKLYLGGDSGYSQTFQELGEKFGPFDLAILECGQYDPMWPLIHMAPEETIQAGLDLKAERVMPVHWGKFALANHSWTDPIVRAVKRAGELNVPLLTPAIGQQQSLVRIGEQQAWWKD